MNISPTTLEDRYVGCLLGLACGDALGTTAEFAARGSFAPITDMVGGGPFELEAGQWTDDTSMALCLAESLLYKKEFDPIDQMNRYVNWWQHGYLSATGECFDIGTSTRSALERYLSTGDPFSGSTSPNAAGNGSLMRLAPIALYFHPDEKQIIDYAAASSRTTHGADEAIESCQLLAAVLHRILRGDSKEELLSNVNFSPTQEKVRAIRSTDFRKLNNLQINGSGYCIDSLNASMWCFMNTDCFKDAVLAAVNLGDDADTTGAITGQIAGAFYGMSNMPKSWIARLSMSDYIQEQARRLHRTVERAL